MTAVSAPVDGFRLPLSVTMIRAVFCRNVPLGTPPASGDAVANQSEAMFVHGGGRMTAEKPCEHLDRQSPERPGHGISPSA
jgi:hypothetical protein